MIKDMRPIQRCVSRLIKQLIVSYYSYTFHMFKLNLPSFLCAFFLFYIVTLSVSVIYSISCALFELCFITYPKCLSKSICCFQSSSLNDNSFFLPMKNL